MMTFGMDSLSPSRRTSRTSDHQIERGRESRLVLSNITYDYQGEYECQAINIINGQERIVASEPVILEVVGAPQVLHFSSAIEAHRGDNVALSLVVCADPRPRHVSWEWGSLRLEAGDSYGKRFIHFFSLLMSSPSPLLSTSSN